MTMLSPDISLPRGVSDFLPDAAAKIGFIEAKIRHVFELWGFRRIIPPKLEYEDVLTIGMGEELKGKTYRFDDRQTGRLLAFPPDITPQIARIVATRLSGWPLPHRISYSGRVLRQTESQTGRSRELFQSGVELIGLDSPEADAEMVTMAIEAMQQLGFDNFKIDLGQVEFCRGIMAASGLDGQPLRELQEAIARKDVSAVSKVLAASTVTEASRREIAALPRLFGGREVVAEAEKVVVNQRSRSALANLRQVLDILDIHGVSDHLTIDLGEIRGLGYHTGITFEGFVSGLGEPVCSGGRYDNLTARYGFAAPATGFTFNVLSLLQALERRPDVEASTTRDFLLFNSRDDRREVLEVARLLRSRGYTAARDIIRREYEDSLTYARRMNIRSMLIIGDEACGNDTYTAVRVRDGKRFKITREMLLNEDLVTFIEENQQAIEN
ncbi:ATP phosphoribosyltransferase regulatory subunit [Oryzomonas japonica]|uniref:ATP phosphoribosyltransferase regulatory subunit n=1 Tax=Oryzomonas japonica TaxID=2603858 RepID=A0A7J4ZWE7_9BACT|nr:ATP phosphoribosyltransferase regulatory subunit [Oryzomonas japonica]KAB0667445.1 ATP phosphoribosyltransferase regulatory subunit [Oryzomonas japonica]